MATKRKTGDDTKTKDEAPTIGKWQEFMANVSVAFHTVTGPRVYVVKKDGRYLRIPQAGASPMGVSSVRLATRFDSALWASSWASMIGRGEDGQLPSVIRLTTKAEREAAKTGITRAYQWTEEPKAEPKSDASVASAAEPLRPRED